MRPTDPHGAPPSEPYDDGVPRGHHDAPDALHNEGVAHEHSDVNVRAILTAAGIIVAVAAVVHVLMWLLFGWLEQGALARDPQISPVARPAVEMPQTTVESPYFGTGDGVQLLTNEFQALEIHRAQEREQLHSYGWVNEPAGVARIPIGRAKELIVERGLPVREFDPVEPWVGSRLELNGEPSGGREITGARPPAAYLLESGSGAAGEPQDQAPQPDPKPEH